MRRTRSRKLIALGALVAVALAACSDGSSDADSTDASGSTTTGAAVEGSDTSDVEHDGARSRVASTDGALVLETTSARADMVSGGDVLVTVSGSAADDAVVTLGDTDVSDQFFGIDDGRRGLIVGLDGEQRISATAGQTSVSITVTDHPVGGPVISGPHLEPWVCTTERAGMGPATDDDCNAEPKTEWSYVADDGSVKPLADPSALPDDVATTDVGGTPVDFVIRTERRTINRGIATIWALDPKPSADGSWDASGWNERLVFRFGGGCGTQYSQGSDLAVSLDTDLLGQGYAVATNTLDTFQTACNDVLSAEAMMMTREHFVEAYGVPTFTIGDGGSGGAIQQLLIASNYPGLLDAVSASVPFPDAISISGGVTDCGLLLDYYRTDGSALTDEQQRAINGHASTGTCAMWERLFLGGVNPTDGCDGEIADQVYDPDTNPDGVRCTLADINVNVLGTDPDTGFARRALDNSGIQYGLGALAAGVIDIEEFLALNERIGGYDIDGNIVAERTVAPEEDIAVAYETGRVTGQGALLDIPVILRNVYTDTSGDIHTRVWPFAIRERMKDGDADNPNLLLWTSPSSGDLIGTLTGAIGNANEPVLLLDEWLTDGERPARAKNQCVLPDGTDLEGGWELYDEAGPCRDAYPVASDPRFVAGQGPRGDILKCALRPIDPADYPDALDDAQRARLEAVFPDGVCDWTQPGVAQVEPAEIWRRY